MNSNNTFAKITYRVATFLIVTLAGFAIFHQLGVRSLWYDEVRMMLRYVPNPFDVTNGDPPFWPFLLHQISRYSRTDFWLRFPNALAFIASTAFLAIAYRKLVGKTTALFVALTFATSYFALSKYQLARPYAFFSFFTIVSFYSFWKILQQRNWKWIPIYISTTFLALHCQYSAFTIVVAQIIFGIPYLIIQLRKDRTLFIRLFLSFAIIILSSLPWYIKFYKSFNAFKSVNGIAAPVNFTFSAFVNLLNIHFFPNTSIIITSLFLCLGFLFSWQRKYRFPVWLITLWLVTSAGTLFWMLTNGKICLASRYFLYFMPAVYLLVCFGITQLSKLLFFWTKNEYLKLSFAIIIFFTFFYYGNFKRFIDYRNYFRNADTKQIDKLLRQCKNNNIPFYYNESHYAFSYYKTPVTRGNPLTKLKEKKLVYFMTDSQLKVEGNLDFQKYDLVYLPYQGVAHLYAIFNTKTSISNYWNRAITVLDNALDLAPYHKQIEDELFAAWLFSGRPDFDSLKNMDIIRKRMNKFLNKKNNFSTKKMWTIKDWFPVNGWSQIEKNGNSIYRWSTRKRSALLLPVYSGKLKKLIFNGFAYSDPKVEYQKIKGWLGNHYLGEQKFSKGQVSFSFVIPRFVEKGERRLLLEFSNPVSPESLGQGGDRRVLALNLQSIKPVFSQVLQDNTFNVGSSNSASWLGANWSHAETWDIKPFRWLDGFTGKVFWTVSSNQPTGEWEIDFQPFKVSGKTQRVSILQNDLVLTNFVLTEGWKTYNIISPPISSGETLLEFVFDYAISPKDINLGNDTRKLSAAVADIIRENQVQ